MFTRPVARAHVIKSRNVEDENKYKSYLKVYKLVLKTAETLYYKEHFDTKANSVKQLWTNIKDLFSVTKTKTEIQKVTIIDNKTITDPKDIANALKNIFCSVGVSLAKSIKVQDLNDLSVCKSRSRIFSTRTHAQGGRSQLQ